MDRVNELFDKFQKYLLKKKKPYVSQVAKDLGLEEYEVYGLLEVAKKRGCLFDAIDGKIVKIKAVKESRIYQIPNDLAHLKLLLISDTHLASKYDRLDILRYLYKEAEEKGVDYVLHAGDVCDGRSHRDEQVYGLKGHSYTGQRDYVVENYPRSNIPTYMISGNHDLWWVKRCGSDIVQDICSKREDLHYLGSDCEDLKIGKLRIRLYHGKGGQAYAKSYRLQKYVDSIRIDERPHILVTGHTHQAFYYRQDQTHCFQTSCLQDLTPFERSMGFTNDKSCWWIDVYMDKKGNPIKITQELECFPGKKLIKK